MALALSFPYDQSLGTWQMQSAKISCLEINKLGLFLKDLAAFAYSSD